MTLSPPLSICAILVASVVGMAIWAPRPSTDAVVSVTLPAEVYGRLAQDARSRTDARGQAMTVGGSLGALAAGAAATLPAVPARP